MIANAQVRKATLVGHSMSTPVAVQFLRMHPEKFLGCSLWMVMSSSHRPTMVKRNNATQYQEFLRAHFHLVGYRDFDGAGHFLMMEQPHAFNKMLREFLDRK